MFILIINSSFNKLLAFVKQTYQTKVLLINGVIVFITQMPTLNDMRNISLILGIDNTISHQLLFI